MILGEIITYKRKEIDECKARFPLSKIWDALTKYEEPHRSFRNSLSDVSKINIIAELKKASPSEGILREDFNAMKLAQLYEAGGAAAISIITESHFFKGRPSYLKTIRPIVSCPILRKDFVIDRYQIFETALLGSDALLLIAAILTEEELKNFIDELKRFKIDPVVEVHTERDVSKAVDAGATIIGINNRNLNDMQIDLRTAERLIPRIPKGILVIVESGIEKREDILRMKSHGISAFLIGTSLIKSNDIIAKLKTLRGVPA